MNSMETKRADIAADRRHTAGFPGIEQISSGSLTGPSCLPKHYGPVVRAAIKPAIITPRIAYCQIYKFVLQEGTNRYYRHKWAMPLNEAEYQAQIAPLAAEFKIHFGVDWHGTPEELFRDWAEENGVRIR